MPTPVNDVRRSVNALVNAGFGSLSFVPKLIDGGRIPSFKVGCRPFITSETFEMVVTRGLPE